MDLLKKTFKSCYQVLQKAPSQMFDQHCVKSIRIRSYSAPYFPAFGLNMERYFVSFPIQCEYRKIRTRITPSTGSVHAVQVLNTPLKVLKEFSFFVITAYPYSEFFQSVYFSVLGLNTKRYSVYGHFSGNESCGPATGSCTNQGLCMV